MIRIMPTHSENQPVSSPARALIAIFLKYDRGTSRRKLPISRTRTEREETMDRKDVYKLIDGERDYQDRKWKDGRPTDDVTTPISAWIIYLRFQLEEAMNAVYFLKEDEALEHIRKIGALSVACMEYNNTKARKL
jgi:hypothetical protein